MCGDQVDRGPGDVVGQRDPPDLIVEPTDERFLDAAGLPGAGERPTLSALGGGSQNELTLVERGEVPAGIVYITDAAVPPKVRIAGIFPPDSHPPIVYPAAIVAGQDTPAARDFLAWLRGESARSVFRRYGFALK